MLKKRLPDGAVFCRIFPKDRTVVMGALPANVNTMTTTEAAQRLVALCRNNEFIRAQKELYDADILRIETDGKQTRGKEKTLAQEQVFLDSLSDIRTAVSEPLVTDAYFSVSMHLTITLKKDGSTHHFNEICVYKVMDGKIVFEQFFR